VLHEVPLCCNDPATRKCWNHGPVGFSMGGDRDTAALLFQ
jgi:hypothetical protein